MGIWSGTISVWRVSLVKFSIKYKFKNSWLCTEVAYAFQFRRKWRILQDKTWLVGWAVSLEIQTWASRGRLQSPIPLPISFSRQCGKGDNGSTKIRRRVQHIGKANSRLPKPLPWVQNVLVWWIKIDSSSEFFWNQSIHKCRATWQNLCSPFESDANRGSFYTQNLWLWAINYSFQPIPRKLADW